MSQNSGNSLVRWLSERRAKDAERETYIENGVISQDDVARWYCRDGWLANLGLSDELAREMASRYVRSKARVRVRPKRYFCDPSLAVALLGAAPERLLGDMQTLGMLFENLVLRDMRVFLSTYGGVGNSVHYFRDEKGLEVDLIVERDGRWGAIEVKLSDAKADDGAKNLKALERKVLSNPAAQNAAPTFLAVMVGRGSIAYTRDDGVAVIPMVALGA